MLWMRSGPANRQTFQARRAPMYLRLVQDTDGRWDVLDQLEDTPKPSEKLFAYVIVAGTWSQIFVRPGGRYEYGHYVFVEPQPSEWVMRDSDRWQEWARQQPPVASS